MRVKADIDSSPAASIQIVSFPIEGMICASCVSRITRHLRKVDGVEAARVDLATESATVRFDPALTDVATLARAIETAGYVARIDQIEAREASSEEPAADRPIAGIRRFLALATRRLLRRGSLPPVWVRRSR